MEVPNLANSSMVFEDDKDRKFTSRRLLNQSIVNKLRKRETYFHKPGTTWSIARSFCQNIIPNFTVVNVEKPQFFLRKFSPDGKHFIVFSSDQTSVEVYEFQGCQAAENLLSSVSGDVLHENSKYSCEFKKFYSKVREQLFSKFFKLKYQIPVACEGQNLNRECSLFTNDGRYVLVVSAAFLSQESHPSFYDIYTNNEAMSPNPKSPLEDYSLHSVDILNGVLQCTVHFKCDKIFPSHNQGLYLYNNVLSVLSVQHQTIHIFHVHEGSLTKTHSIGRFCFEGDLHTFQQVYGTASENIQREPYHDVTINSLKHRILAYLFERASIEGKDALLHFYQQFGFLEDLRIWRMQLLDESHLLVKYASQDVVGLRITDPSAQPSFFVVYNFREAKVLATYENTSMYLLNIFEKNPGLFRCADVLRGQLQAACSDMYANQIQQRHKDTIVHAKYGGTTEAVKRLLAQLPVSSQSHSASPYLDLALFSYDDKWISTIERPKPCADYPIRFYSRESGILKFQIRVGSLLGPGNSAQRKLVAFTFHPYEPFAISVQRINSDYVFNFHFRHVPDCC